MRLPKHRTNRVLVTAALGGIALLSVGSPAQAAVGVPTAGLERQGSESLKQLGVDAPLTIPVQAARQEVAITEGNPDDPNTWGYTPPELSIKAGTTVAWTNQGNQPHTVSATDSSFDSQTLKAGESWENKFDTAGAFDYVCAFHSQMFGKVTVTAVAAPAEPAPAPAKPEPAPAKPEPAPAKPETAPAKESAAAPAPAPAPAEAQAAAPTKPVLANTGAAVGTLVSLGGGLLASGRFLRLLGRRKSA